MYCNYCKEKISENEGYTVSEGNYYHVHCYNLLLQRDSDFEFDDEIDDNGDYE